jgi:hypothetical protein
LHADGVDVEPDLFPGDAVAVELADVEEPEVAGLPSGPKSKPMKA